MSTIPQLQKTTITLDDGTIQKILTPPSQSINTFFAIFMAIVTAAIIQYIFSQMANIPDFPPYRQWEMTKIFSIFLFIIFITRDTSDILIIFATIITGIIIYIRTIRIDGINLSTKRVTISEFQNYNFAFGGVVAVTVAIYVSLFLMEQSFNRKMLSLAVISLFGISVLVDYLVAKYSKTPEIVGEPKILYRQWWISLMVLFVFSCFEGKFAGFAVGLASVFFIYSITVYGPDSTFAPEPIFINKLPSASYIYNMMMTWAKNNQIIQ
jgi:hypothetical protein